jgi:hypothetical protein
MKEDLLFWITYGALVALYLVFLVAIRMIKKADRRPDDYEIPREFKNL